MGPLTRLSLAAATALLAACATPYRPDSILNQGGYSEQRRAPNLYAVWFRGNVNTPTDRCEELAVLRAAELCLADSKPFMRTSDFQTTAPSVHWVPSGEREPPQTALKVECLAEKSDDTQDAAAVAESTRKRYRITSKPRP